MPLKPRIVCPPVSQDGLQAHVRRYFSVSHTGVDTGTCFASRPRVSMITSSGVYRRERTLALRALKGTRRCQLGFYTRCT